MALRLPNPAERALLALSAVYHVVNVPRESQMHSIVRQLAEGEHVPKAKQHLKQCLDSLNGVQIEGDDDGIGYLAFTAYQNALTAVTRQVDGHADAYTLAVIAEAQANLALSQWYYEMYGLGPPPNPSPEDVHGYCRVLLEYIEFLDPRPELIEHLARFFGDFDDLPATESFHRQARACDPDSVHELALHYALRAVNKAVYKIEPEASLEDLLSELQGCVDTALQTFDDRCS